MGNTPNVVAGYEVPLVRHRFVNPGAELIEVIAPPPKQAPPKGAVPVAKLIKKVCVNRLVAPFFA